MAAFKGDDYSDGCRREVEFEVSTTTAPLSITDPTFSADEGEVEATLASGTCTSNTVSRFI